MTTRIHISNESIYPSVHFRIPVLKSRSRAAESDEKRRGVSPRNKGCAPFIALFAMSGSPQIVATRQGMTSVVPQNPMKKRSRL